MRGDPCYLEFIPVHFKRQDMCIKAIEKAPWILQCVSDPLNTLAMYERSVGKFPEALGYVSDHLKTQEMCKKTVEEDP